MNFIVSKRPIISVALAVLLALSFLAAVRPSEAEAATQTEIDDALAAGAAYLAAQQDISGAWQTSRWVGTTGLAVTTLAHYAEHLGQDPLSPGYAYSSHIQAGLDYIFSPASAEIVRRNSGDGRVWWGGTTETSGDNYVIGPAIMAIVMSGAPNKVVEVAGSAVQGMTYRRVVEEALNYLDYTQCKTGNGIGSWDYYGVSTSGDQSIAGWVTLGLGYATSRFDVAMPTDIIAKLDQGIDIMQWTESPVDAGCYGGAGYYSYSSPPYNSWINIYKTGHLLYMMGLVGDTATTPRVQRSLGFIERHWNHESSGQNSSTGCPTPGWRGNPPGLLPSYIATVATMKGLLKLGIDMVGPYDWYEEFSDVIVANQSPDGSWTQGGYPSHYDPMLHTTWAMLTLLRAVPEPTAPPVVSDFTADPTTGPAPLPVRFTDLSEGEIRSWFWEFGDGFTSNQQHPSHTYKRAGTYTVTLTVTDVLGASDSTSRTFITVTRSRQTTYEPRPAQLMVSSLLVIPEQVHPNQQVEVFVSVANSGGTAGAHDVNLYVNGHHEGSHTVSVAAGSSSVALFTVIRSQPGTYHVSVDGHQGQFIVLGGQTTHWGGPLGTGGIIAIIVVALALVLGLVLVFRRR
jgi:PKD repeat protein